MTRVTYRVHTINVPSIDREFEAYIIEEFGGFTRVEAHGAWKSPTKVVRERMYVYSIAVPMGPTGLDTIFWFNLVTRAIKIYRHEQEIYTVLPGGEAVLHKGQGIPHAYTSWQYP